MERSLQERKTKLSPTKQLLLEKRLRGESTVSSSNLHRIASLPRPERLPLSYAQQRLWFIDRLEGSSAEYNMPLALRLRGALDRKAIERTINTIVSRHESLRTHFCEVDGVPEQVIEPELRIELPLEDLSVLDEKGQQERMMNALREESRQPFDLARGPLLRVRLLKLSEQDHLLLRTMHHIVSDGWSQGVFNREFAVLYEAYRDERENPFNPLPVQYADFALWQRSWLDEQRLGAGLDYWKQQLAGIPERLDLPTDRPRPPIQTFAAEAYQLKLSNHQLAALKQLSQTNQATLYMTLLAAFGLLLARYSGQQDIVLGSPIANRQEAQLEELIGFFVNTLVLRLRLNPELSFTELLAEVKRTALQAYEHQNLPFERLVEELSPQRSLNTTPLFQVLFALQNAPWAPQRMKELEVEPLGGDELQVRFDLEVHALEQEGEIIFSWLFNRDLFDRWRIQQMAGHYLRLLEALLADPHLPIGCIDLLGVEERRQILHSWNETARALPPATLPQLFEQQVEMTPQALALVYQAEELSYRELNERANRLAHLLINQGIGPEDLVALALPRSVEMVVSLLAILKAGAAYLPIDPDYPHERIAFMLKDAEPRCLITTREIADKLHRETPKLILPELLATLLQHPTTNPQDADRCRPLNPHNPAYAIYTSGSTGLPKGASNTHRGLLNRLLWMQAAYHLDHSDRVLQKTPFGFDVSVWEFFWPLLFGARLVIAPPGKHRDPHYLLDAIREQGITTLHFVPPMLAAFLEHPASTSCQGLRRVICSGEALSGDLQQLFFARLPHVKLYNLYGPTEAAIDVTEWTCSNAHGDRTPPIGRPISNTQAYVLDARLQPVPVGVPGELYIAGAGLARGYLKRPALTAERFLANPFGPPGSRIYRTGDLARWRPDGNLEFLGRSDQQLKIRGFRVEPGEIEAALRKHERVQDAVVTVRGEGDEQRLTGYVICQSTENEQEQKRISHISEWRQLYESIYAANKGMTGDFNIVGWESSYTSEPIAVEEMRIWLDETLIRLRLLKPARVLEIGCGTGLLLTRLAANCESYVGLDFSVEVLEQLKSYLSTRSDLKHVELRQGLAHELSFVANDSVDLVIINSVIQYFPDVDYLLEVLAEAVRVTQRGGHIFVGDVRSLPLLEAYHTSVQLHKAAGEVRVGELRQRIRQGEWKEEELAINPSLFEELGRRWEKLGRVETWLKTGAYDNELSRFRYDVVIELGDKEVVLPPERCVRWDETGCWREAVEQWLAEEPNLAVEVRGIHDGRVAQAFEAVRLLREDGNEITNVEQLRAVCGEIRGEDPNAVMELAGRLGIKFSWLRLRTGGLYDGVFNPCWGEVEGIADAPRAYYRRYGNVPMRGVKDRELGRALREYLRQSLPDYMVPSVIVELESLPLTPNGKLDRHALPQPELISTAGWRAPRSPQEEILCSLFAEVLGVERVGIDDNFFELGGHSLLATRLASRLRATLAVELAIRTLFESPTVAQLALRLGESDHLRHPLLRQKRPERLPLSYAQQRLWFIDRLEASSTQYNMPFAFRLRGALDQEALARAINTIVARHESLRTHFAEVDGEPQQVIEPELQIDLPLEDLSALAEMEQEGRVIGALRDEAALAFDLARGPLLRVRLLRLSEQDHLLLRTMHHIVSDGWSEALFNRELSILYQAFCNGADNPLPPLAVQYADYALWERKEQEALRAGLDYWKMQLAGIPERLDLPTDRPRPPIQTFAAEAYQLRFSAEQLTALKQLSQTNQATLYMTLLAAFGLLLARYSGQQDIVLGSPIANRQEAQLEELIGFFVNTLVLRLRLNPELSFTELLAEVKRTALQAYEHQNLPFERLVEELSPQRSLNTTPLFQVLFALQNAPWAPQRMKELEVEPLGGDELRVRFDLEVHALEQEGEIIFSWLFNRDLFDRWRIQQMAGHYLRLLEALLADPHQPVGCIDMLAEQERRQMLHSWNETTRALPPATLPQLFEQQVEMTPQALALVYQAEELSYRELNERANRLAHLLINQGIGPEELVALALPRSVEMVVSLLAILKAGAAYLPIDPDYPHERIAFMLKDAEPACLITTSEIVGRLPESPRLLILDYHEIIEALTQDLTRNPKDGERIKPLSSHNPAYVIYTSGSTGLPKGVIVTHQNVVRLFGATDHWFQFGVDDVWTLFHSYAFDFSVWEIWGPLLYGGRLVIVPYLISRSAAEFLHFLARNRVTVLNQTPSAFYQLMQADQDELDFGESLALRYVIFGGEALELQRLEDWYKRHSDRRPSLVNMYGITETTVHVSFIALDQKAIKSAHSVIGRGIPDLQVYLLNARLQPVPVGVPGELYIAGAGLARGYLKRPALTAERFLANPFDPQGTRMYRTGDLARWRPDGNLEFLGRSDQQLKIRGFRVEPGEIEAALRELPQIAQAAVIACQDRPGEKLLAAYLTPAPGHRIDTTVLRRHLAQRLPDYMIPAAIVELDTLPLTPNGKLDRQALPQPELISTAGWRAPRSPQEEILCSLFAEVLGVERVGIDDNFFELGGHSLLATRLASRLRATLAVELAIRTLFESPTVAQLALRLGESDHLRHPLLRQKRPERLPLSYAQQRLWFIDRLEASSTQYNMPFAFRLRGALDQEALARAINTIVARHESLRTHFAEVDGEPQQVIEPELQIDLPLEDLSALAEMEQEGRVIGALRDEAALAFDLARGPLLRVRLLRLSEQDHLLLRTMHHIVSDGWSEALFNRELSILYQAFCNGADNPLPPLAVQYADYALWERKEQEALRAGLDYWKIQLAGIPERLDLPTDRPRPPIQTFAAEAYQLSFSAEQLTALKQLSQTNQATLYMTLLAAFGLLLARYSNQQDIVLGSPIANRQEAQLEELIGFFVNTLVLRLRLNPELSFTELLAEVKRTALQAYEHQNLPFERLVEELSPQRSLNTTPLFQVVFALQNAPRVEQHMEGLTAEPLAGDELRVRCDLEVHALEQEGEIIFSWLFNRDLFDRWRIQQMAGHYLRLLEALLADPHLPIGCIDLLGVEERRQILHSWNETARALPPATLPQLFEQQVEMTPQALALVYQAEELSYRELNERANRLAHLLINQGIGPEDLVALALPRSVEMVVSLLAILKAGAAYLPIDPDYPHERIAFMLKDAEPRCLITTREIADKLHRETPKLILPELLATLLQHPTTNPQDADRCRPLNPHNPAYAIYTSGSTGLPKGASNTHRGLLNRLLWMQAAYHLDHSDRVLQKTPFGFDVSVWEFFWPLLFGARLVIAPPGKHRDPHYLLDAIREQGITTLHFVPPMLAAFLEHPASTSCQGLRRVICSGEALSGDLQQLFFARLPHVKLYNLYGPTEAAIDVTEWTCSNAHGDRTPPIGRPISNTQAYVLDARLQPVPVGVPGELYIAGAGLARGYLKRPALTAERFLANPFGPPGSRIYRTGDLARWRPDGNLEFLGRSDQQLKIRGFRVEPGEIEAALRELPQIAQAAVIARQERPGEKLLAAYLTPAPGHRIDTTVLRRHLAQRLPDYMIPAAIVELDTLPLTPNGKLDRQALPQPELISTAGWRAPRSPQEEILCSLFAEVLGVERVGIDDNFFELGGHSLLATRLASRLRATLAVELAIRTLFESPTVAQLALRLGESDHLRHPLLRQKRPERLPLSYAQQRLWFIDRLEASSTQYNMPFAFRLRGALDQEALARAINTIVARHESLRTHFAEVDGEPQQVIEPELQIDLPLEDLSALAEMEQEGRVIGALRDEAALAFDLARGPLLRVRLLRLSEQDHLLLRTMHHIVSDGWSEALFNRELSILYQAFCNGADNPLPPLAVQYADYALWERKEQEALRAGLDYWKMQLAGIPERLDLPTDRPRPPIQTFAAEAYQLRFSAEQLTALKQLSQTNQATLYMTLLAAFGLLLARYSNQQDIVLGSPIANRQEAQLEELIGFFVNTLVLRLRLNPELSFTELLAEVKRTALQAYEHQNLPFERLVEELSPQRSLNTTPLFQVVFALQNAPRVEQHMEGLTAEPLAGDELRVRCDLEVHALEQEGEIIFSWLFNRDLFDRWRIQQMADHYLRLLEAVLADPHQPVGCIDLLGVEERRQILHSWNETARALPPATLPQLFEQQVEMTPQALALVYQAEELSYRELNERANRLAHLLINQGIGPEDLVALALPRSVEMVVSLLAILKAGAAYLPIDPDYPHERIAFMLEDACPACLITTTETFGGLPESPRPLILDRHDTVEALKRSLNRNPGNGARKKPLRPENPAYVVYTSGSTGTPKGAVISHVGLPCLAASQIERFALNPDSRVLQLASPSFDAAVMELLMAFAAGATLVLPQPGLIAGDILADALIDLKISHALIPPTGLASLPIIEMPDFQTLIAGGEPCSAELVSSWGKDRQMINAYGPTETTVCATLSRTLSAVEAPPIGQPIWNTRVYVLDASLQPVPVGVPGELYIAGAGLARGYLKRPALTAERFLANPFDPQGTRMYRTGDLARWRPDGNLEFLGRSDQQLKIRGFRVEPGEIEAALRELPQIAQAAVIARQDRPGERLLAAYLTPAPGHRIDTTVLRRHLAQRLPDYMIPAAIVELDTLPLTPNGKLDRHALPQPELISTAGWRAPRSPKEEILCSLFAEVLGVERVGIDDNFFELGGHSLLAIRLVSRIQSNLGVDLKIRSLFEAPTVAELGIKMTHPTEQNEYEVILPLRSQGSHPPLFCIHPAVGLSWCYTRLMQHVRADYPIYGLQARHLTEPGFLPQTIEEIAADYIDQIRRIQTYGPYHLIGWSLGGLVAHAIANIFQQEGNEVALLGLLDAYPPAIQKNPEPMTQDLLHSIINLYISFDTGTEFSGSSSLMEFINRIEDYPLNLIIENVENSLTVTNTFIPKRFDGNLLLFTSADSESSGGFTPEIWMPYITGEIEVHSIPCTHHDMLLCNEPAAQIGKILTKKLEKLNQWRK